MQYTVIKNTKDQALCEQFNYQFTFVKTSNNAINGLHHVNYDLDLQQNLSLQENFFKTLDQNSRLFKALKTSFQI